MATDPTSVLLAEYQALRTELMTHFAFANALVGLQVAAIGVSATVLDAGSVLIAGFALLTTVIWVSYLDHIASIYRIALYIGTILRDQIEGSVGQPVMQWESWFRRLRSVGIVPTPSGRQIIEHGTEPRLGLTYPSVFSAERPLLTWPIISFNRCSRANLSRRCRGS